MRPRARTTWATTTSAPTPPNWPAARSRCTAFLHRQALALRLGEVDRAALRFLIESLNDDGYLEDSLGALAAGLAGDDLEQAEELEHRFSMALGLLQSLEPTGVGARHLGECLSLQLKARLADAPERRRSRPPRCASVRSRWTCWRGATSSA